MKKLLIIPLMLLGSILNASDMIQQYRDFNGMVDAVTPDKLDFPYSPILGCLNVRTDEESMIKSRLGIGLYNSTQLNGNPRKLFTYDKVNGDSYIICNASGSFSYSRGDTNFTAIITTNSQTAIDDYAVGEGILYRDNGVNGLGGKWDGTTYTNFDVTNTTSMVSGKYIKYWHNRLWKAGVSGDENTVYWSAPYDPMYMEGFQTLPDLGGDVITGMYVWGLSNSLIITQRYHTYEIVEYEGGSFTYRQLSNSIGCLYQSSMGELNGFPVWMSARGIEQWTGDKFELLSRPIDTYVRNLRQLVISQQNINIDSAEDWGNGTEFVNVDTVTYSGSVNMVDSTENHLDFNEAATLNLSTTGRGQTFYLDEDKDINRIVFKIGDVTLPGNAIIKVSLGDSNFQEITSTTTDIYSKRNQIWSFPISTQHLIANTTYSITISSYSGFNSGTADIYIDSDGDYNKGNMYSKIAGIWTSDATQDMYFTIADTTTLEGSYSSEILYAENWGSWGSFYVEETAQQEYSALYYLKTSTAADNFALIPGIPISHNDTIPSSVGGYIQIIASITMTAEYPAQPNSYIVKLDRIIANYYANSSNNFPIGISFKDRYGIAVSTGDSTTNNVILWYQKNQGWTMDTASVASQTIYRDKLYTGDANNGYIYEREKSDTTTDNGTAFLSRWTSNIFMPNPIYKTLFKEIWVKADNTSNSATLNYRFDGSTSTYTSKTLNLTNPYGIVIRKIPLVNSKYNAFQFQVESYYPFKIKEFDLIYDNVWTPQ